MIPRALTGAQRALQQAGFEVLHDWLPAAVAYRHPDRREVDLHPVTPTPDGGGGQYLTPNPPFHYGQPVIGVIAGRRFLCVDGHIQLRAHCGYTPTPKDRADVATLTAHLRAELPAAYR